jgi:hypothetical protein
LVCQSAPQLRVGCRMRTVRREIANWETLSPGRGFAAGAPICNATLRFKFIYYSALQTKMPILVLGSGRRVLVVVDLDFVHNLLHVGNLLGEVFGFLLLFRGLYGALEYQCSVLRRAVNALIV